MRFGIEIERVRVRGSHVDGQHQSPAHWALTIVIPWCFRETKTRG
jgi:hypothetical protein